MKVITIKEPYASLIAKGLKEYEFRTWPTQYRGPILIQASKKPNREALKTYKDLDLNYMDGYIFAKANLTECTYIDDEMRKYLKAKNYRIYKGIIDDKSWQGYGFKLENIELIEPIKINGKLGLWNYDTRTENRPVYEEYRRMLGYEEMPEFLKKYLQVPSLIRLRDIGYFCGMDYASKDIYNFKEYISRYDHSLTVALATWKYTHDKKSTLAGLFHDIATPCFAHVIDYMNKDYEKMESTEEATEYILKHDKKLISLLKKDSINIEEIIDFKKYSIVDIDRPKLCTDRLDGIILPGIFWTKSIDIDDARKIVDDIKVFTNECGEREIGFQNEKIARIALMASDSIDRFCHSDEDNYMMELLAKITRESIENKIITYDELYTSTENEIMYKLETSKNRKIEKLLNHFKTAKKDEIIATKNANIKIKDLNPLVNGNRLKK